MVNNIKKVIYWTDLKTEAENGINKWKKTFKKNKKVVDNKVSLLYNSSCVTDDRIKA
jgi:hypothetical protein